MKFVVSDLDGTLLYSHTVVSDYTINTVKKLIDKGINFAIATGRGKQGVEKFLTQLEITPYLICNNGANIYNPQGECIFEQRIPKNTAMAILKEIRANNLFYSAFLNEYFYHSKDEAVEDFISRPLFTEIPLEKEEDCPEVNKIIVQDNNPEIILNITKILKEKFSDVAEIMMSQANCLDIAPKNCTKGTGIQNLAKIFNLTPDDFMAFGDGENDIDMLNTVGHPVIMENAQDILKKQFPTVTLTNTEHGVAKYLEKYFDL